MTANEKIQEIRERAARREAAYVAEALAAIDAAIKLATLDPSESSIMTWQAVCNALRATGACSVPSAEVSAAIGRLASLTGCDRCYRHSARLAVGR